MCTNYVFTFELPCSFDQILNVVIEQTNRFLLKFTGKDEEINLLCDGTERQEFGKWLWISIEQLLNQVSKLLLAASFFSLTTTSLNFYDHLNRLRILGSLCMHKS